MSVVRFLSAMLLPISLSACVATAAGNLDEQSTRYEEMLPLTAFAPGEGGAVVFGYVENWRDTHIRLPAPPTPVFRSGERRAEGTFDLGAFYEPDPFNQDEWVAPEIELGALYYVPKRYDDDSGALVVQKLCGITKGHGLENVAIQDTPAAQTGQRTRRKVTISGSVAQGIFRTLVGASIGVSANANYLAEVELKDVRRRFLNPTIAKNVLRNLLSGNDCRERYIPSVRGNRILFLREMYYGTMTVHQVGEIAGDLEAGPVAIAAGHSLSDGADFFVAFQWFQEIDIDEFVRNGESEIFSY